MVLTVVVEQVAERLGIGGRGGRPARERGRGRLRPGRPVVAAAGRLTSRSGR